MKKMKNSKGRSIRTALGAFLIKMRLGLSNRVMASFFHLPGAKYVSRVIHSVRQSLVNEFTCHYIGFNHVTRQSVLDNHQTALATDLFTTSRDQVCILMDGTYLYIQKSSHNEMQRKTYSIHKHRHLVKPMIITTTVSFPYFFS
jgi:hypothetical protein